MKRKRISLSVTSDSDQEAESQSDGSSSACLTIQKGNRLKSKRVKKENASFAEEKSTQNNPLHFFTCSKEVNQFRSNLLRWYDENKRDLPWRKWADHPDPDQRAYAVWVSEIMLQQTKVVTVIDYYNRWMEKVNEMWAGLGYYSRGRRLFEGARKVCTELSGVMPKDEQSLMKQLPGVGRYTAGAIASIAFKQPTGVVDGNVIRVLARTRAIGANSTNVEVQSAIWSLANTLVDRKRPGDFNQAIMELGATVCTPSAPSCDQCPIKDLCRAHQHVEKVKQLSAEKNKRFFTGTVTTSADTLPDIECVINDCRLCLPSDAKWESDLGVMNYPRKPKKKPPRKEQTAVCVVERKHEESLPSYLLIQRPETGLLAGLWEFPSVAAETDWSKSQRRKAIDAFLNDEIKIKPTLKIDRREIAQIVHVFSHIEQTYLVESFTVSDKNIKETPGQTSRPYQWLTSEALQSGAISTAMKKCFSALQKSRQPQKFKSDKVGPTKNDTKQTSLKSFFKLMKDEDKS